MSDQLSMFPPSVEAMSLTISRGMHGWHLRIAARIEGTRWTDTTWHEYERLSFAEMLEVVEATALQMGSKDV